MRNFATLSYGRWYAGSVVLDSDLGENSLLWITGGTGTGGWIVLQNSEYVYSDGTVMMGPELPEHIDEHCAVNVNKTHTLLITGEAADSGTSGITYFFNHVSQEWSQGPRLKQGRYRFACGLFKNEYWSENTVIVAGGFSSNGGYPFTSVEVLPLDDPSLGWETGMKDSRFLNHFQ